MTKTIFIIAGFKHSASEEQYDWMKKYVKTKGFRVKVPEIEWNNRVLTEYVAQFTSYYKKHKTDTNYVLGFSYGAMIALVSASDLDPDKLYLCSLSPYFAEDLGSLKKSWKTYIGQRRLDDFSNYSAISIAKNIEIPTVIFYGQREGEKYPQLKIRCEETHSNIKSSKLVKAKDAPHRIDHPSYVKAIKAELN